MLEKNKKRNNILLGIFCVASFILIGIFTAGKIKDSNRIKIANEIIAELDNYKGSHGHYPSLLSTVHTKEIGWLYYFPGSDGQSFALSYTQGIMQSNTIVYDSQTGKWGKKFNY